MSFGTGSSEPVVDKGEWLVFFPATHRKQKEEEKKQEGHGGRYGRFFYLVAIYPTVGLSVSVPLSFC